MRNVLGFALDCVVFFARISALLPESVNAVPRIDDEKFVAVRTRDFLYASRPQLLAAVINVNSDHMLGAFKMRNDDAVTLTPAFAFVLRAVRIADGFDNIDFVQSSRLLRNFSFRTNPLYIRKCFRRAALLPIWQT